MKFPITDDRLDSVINNYYNQLVAMGYVKHDTVVRILVYMFILDLIDVMGDYITREDYDLLANIYRKLFADGCCLLPYDEFCVKRAFLGLPDMTDS